MKERRVIVAQLGARMHYGVPRLLQATGSLERLYTDICVVKGWPQFLRLIPSRFFSGGLRRLQGRVPIGIPSKKITAFTHFGYEYASRRCRARSVTEMSAVHLWASDRFNELILSRGFGSASLVYGFNSASEELLKGASASGLRGVVEQTIAPRSAELRLLNDEIEAFPEWGKGLVDENAEAFSSREQREWVLADRILVASEFVKDEIAAAGGPVDKCKVVPYGVERERFSMSRAVDLQQGSKVLRVLFVGGVGLRKGVPYLLAALRRLQGVPIRCRIVGGFQVDRKVLSGVLPKNVELVGSVPRAVIDEEYAHADVFCLPGLCEGSATVVYEALAAGLPVVTTVNTGSIVRDGVEGFIIPIRDVDAIAARLELLAKDRMLLAAMSEAARARSAYGSLEAYGGRLLDALGLKSAVTKASTPIYSVDETIE